MKFKISLKHDSKKNIKSKNPILRKNELFVECRKDGSHAYKFGDGIHPYNELDYIRSDQIPFEFNVYGEVYTEVN